MLSLEELLLYPFQDVTPGLVNTAFTPKPLLLAFPGLTDLEL